jgi:glycosyltransferase involved in cell wall biosynthesis
LKQKVKDLGLVDNVTFAGFQQKQEDAYNILSNASIYVLPTYHDIIPGTLIEAMFLKIPSITYNVGGIPSLNKEKGGVVLVEKGDIGKLSDSIVLVYTNKAYAISLAENAYSIVSDRFNNDLISPELIKYYENCILEQ